MDEARKDPPSPPPEDTKPRGGWFARFRRGGDAPAPEAPVDAPPETPAAAPPEAPSETPPEILTAEPAAAPPPPPPSAAEPAAPAAGWFARLRRGGDAPAPQAPLEAPPGPPSEPPPAAPTAAPAAEPAAPAAGWFQRLKRGLTRSSSKLTDGIAAILTKRKLDDAAIEALEELLITADLGVETAGELAANLRRTRFGKDVTDAEVRGALAADIARILEPVAKPLTIDPARKPHVVLVVGVNGSGKTTTIGKLASLQRMAGHSVMLAAGDTFRAAAVEQLRIWGERAGVPVVSRAEGTDAAALAFDALGEARAAGADLLLIDTAGRLHNKADLMAELAKVVRVVKKLDPAAPHDCLLVLDATTGQNAHAQVEIFRSMVAVTGLVVTKLDGSAKGGVLVGLAQKFGLPVHAVGVGETLDDLRPFAAKDFADGLMGLRD
jgi:fused signal recognition particle receptor